MVSVQFSILKVTVIAGSLIFKCHPGTCCILIVNEKGWGEGKVYRRQTKTINRKKVRLGFLSLKKVGLGFLSLER